jgi:membrane-associated phospholipid phosphatase
MIYPLLDYSFYVVIIILFLYKQKQVWKPFFLLMVLVHLLKVSVHKERPDQSDFYSFPSGHAAAAWFFVVAYQWNPILFVWAMLISMSRVIYKRHDELDVIAGTLLGILVPYLYIHYHGSFRINSNLFRPSNPA